MKRDQVRRVGIIGVGIAAAVAAWFFFLREPAPKPSAPTTPASATSEASATSATSASGPLRWEWERERQGPLRLRGQVVNEAGQPVNDAVVWISTVPPAATRTQADGSFSFDKLIGRTYQLSARVEATGSAMVGGTYYKLTSASDPVVLQLSAGATVAVLVQDEAKQPVRGAKISLRGQEELGDDAPTAPLTGDDGKALLRGVESGWTALVAEAPGFATTGTITKVGAALADGSPAAEIVLTIRRGVAVSGQVVDERGQPVAGARIGFDAPSVRGGMSYGVLAKTDEKGAFRFAALAPNQYTFRATDGEHVISTSQPVDVGDQPVSGVRITMKPGGVVTGSVVDTKGAPVPYVVVRSAPSTEDGTRIDASQAMAAARQAVADASGFFTSRSQPFHVNSSTTDSSGAFTLRGLPEGRFRVWVDRGGTNLNASAVEISQLAKTGDRDVRLVLQPPGRILGKIVTSDGKPPALAKISLPHEPLTITRDGSFVIADVEPAKQTLRVSGPDFLELKVPGVVVTPGQDTDLRILTVARGRRVTGTVVDGDKRPVAGAKIDARNVRVSMPGDDPPSGASLDDLAKVVSTTSDARGAFSLGGLSTAYTLQITAETAAGRSKTVAIAPGEDDPAPVTLQLRGFGSISGVATLNGKLSAEIQLTVTLTEDSPSSSLFRSDDFRFISPNADGSYTFDRLPAGVYDVNASRDGAKTVGVSGEVKVRGGQQSKLDLDIKSK